MERSFSTRIKVKYHIVLPMTVFLIGLMLPQVHWLLALGIGMFVFWLRLANQTNVKVSNERIVISYPFMPIRGTLSYGLGTLEKVVYVDRTKALPNSYNKSHVNVYRKGYRVQHIRIILDSSEIDRVKEVLSANGVKFEYTTKMEENYV